MRRLAFALLALFAHATGVAQVAPDRYIDGQGIEIIVNRGGAPVQQAGAHAPGVVSEAAAAPRAAAAPALRDPVWRVNASEQAARDRDRSTILAQELATEMQALTTKQALAAKAALAGKSGTAPARINEEINEHQRNILALEAELRRNRAQRR